MGAAKPGSTFQPQGGVPPQGGKGGVQSPKPTLAPAQGASMPAQGGKGGVQQPGQPPYMPIGLPPAQVPAQGGKAQNPDGTYTGNLGIPPQGGKSQADIDRFNADMAAKRANGGVGLSNMVYGGGGQQPAPVMPAQPQRDLGYGNPPPRVPAQGNKGPITLPPGVEGFPAPQVPPQVQQPGQAVSDQLKALYAAQAGLNASRPQVQQPAPSMPRPVSQVMPRQPTPKPAPLGLAGLRGRR